MDLRCRPARRALLAHLFNGPLTATPTQTDEGARFLLEGRASLDAMLTFDTEGVGDQKPPEKRASPRGFAPFLYGVHGAGRARSASERSGQSTGKA